MMAVKSTSTSVFTPTGAVLKSVHMTWMFMLHAQMNPSTPILFALLEGQLTWKAGWRLFIMAPGRAFVETTGPYLRLFGYAYNWDFIQQ